MVKQLEKIIAKRGSGITTNLVKRSSAEGFKIVTCNREQVDWVKQTSMILKLEIPDPITFNDFIKGGNNFKGGFFIDNLDIAVLQMSRLNPKKEILGFTIGMERDLNKEFDDPNYYNKTDDIKISRTKHIGASTEGFSKISPDQWDRIREIMSEK